MGIPVCAEAQMPLTKKLRLHLTLHDVLWKTFSDSIGEFLRNSDGDLAGLKRPKRKVNRLEGSRSTFDLGIDEQALG